MSKINTVAFMAGYMDKQANPFGAGPMNVAQQAQAVSTANKYLSPEQQARISAQDKTRIGQAVQGSTANQFLGNQQNRDLTTMGGGAALGAGLGYMAGGDLGSTLMGTALGGLVGWLAKHFFGGKIDDAYNNLQQWFNQGTADSVVKQLSKSNPNAATELQSRNIDVKAAIEEQSIQQTKQAINNVNEASTPAQRAEAQAALEMRAKEDAKKAEAGALQTGQEGPVYDPRQAGGQPMAPAAPLAGMDGQPVVAPQAPVPQFQDDPGARGDVLNLTPQFQDDPGARGDVLGKPTASK